MADRRLDAGMAIVAAPIAAGVADLAHLGLGGALLAGSIGAIVAFNHGTDIYHFGRGLLPLPDSGVTEPSIRVAQMAYTGKRTRFQRLFGIYPEDQEAVVEEDKIIGPGGVKPTNAPQLALPQRSPTFRRMYTLVRSDMDILGYDGKEFVFADPFKHSLHMGIIGLSNSGKTGCLKFHVACAVMRNAVIRGWDLHGDVVADMGDLFTIFDDAEDIIADCDNLQAELDRRKALRKRVLKKDPEAIREWENTRELFYIVDEFLALMNIKLSRRKADKDKVAQTVLSIIAEGRKFKVRCVIAGQTMPAALFGDGGSSARDTLPTKYIFKSDEDQARYFGLNQKAIDALLPLIVGDDTAGYAVLQGGPLMQPRIISIPYTTTEDIREVVSAWGYVNEDIIAQDMIDDEPMEELQPNITVTYERSQQNRRRTYPFDEWSQNLVRNDQINTPAWYCWAHYSACCDVNELNSLSKETFMKALAQYCSEIGYEGRDLSGIKENGTRGVRKAYVGLSIMSEEYREDV